MFDLGGTLVDGTRPFPHVPEALSALTRFETEDGDRFEHCLVSDFTMADPPAGPAQVRARFREYLDLLDGFGLRGYFRPAERRITLSTHAGVRKPDPRVYRTALSRLGSPATLQECLVVTEDGAHLAACSALGMTTLGFGPDFTDWLDAPLLVRRLVAPASSTDTYQALRPWFAARDARLVAVIDAEGAARAQVRIRVPVTGPDGTPGARRTTTTSTVVFDPSGRVQALTGSAPADDETAVLLDSLRAGGQLGVAGAPLAPGVTHTEAIDEHGSLVPRRRRFSAI